MKKTALILLTFVLLISCAVAEDAPVIGSADATTEIVVTGETMLPPYVYPGDDPIEAAVAEYICAQDMSYLEENNVTIPSPVILKVEAVDDTHAKVYGNFWYFSYTLNGTTLVMTSGGEMPGIMALEKGEDGWKVTSLEEAESGDDYYDNISALCGGDKELEEKFFETTNGDSECVVSARKSWILAYVEANGLNIDSYQDPYWDPIPLK